MLCERYLINWRESLDNEWQQEIIEEDKKEKLARKILGISADANLLEIKKSYWLLSMKYHPDKNPNNKESLKKFQNIKNAYEFLIKKENGNNLYDENEDNEKTIGDFNENEWGYYCWWRDNFN